MANMAASSSAPAAAPAARWPVGLPRRRRSVGRRAAPLVVADLVEDAAAGPGAVVRRDASGSATHTVNPRDGPRRGRPRPTLYAGSRAPAARHCAPRLLLRHARRRPVRSAGCRRAPQVVARGGGARRRDHLANPFGASLARSARGAHRPARSPVTPTSPSRSNTRTEPSSSMASLAYFAVRNADVETDKLTHRRLGSSGRRRCIRGAVVKLNLASTWDRRIHRIRFWLRAERNFPRNAVSLAEVFPPDRAQIALSGPYEAVRQRSGRFLLHLPKCSSFTLNVGKTVDHTIRSLCIQTKSRASDSRFHRHAKLTQQLSMLFTSHEGPSLSCAQWKRYGDDSARSNTESISRPARRKECFPAAVPIGSGTSAATSNGEPAPEAPTDQQKLRALFVFAPCGR